MAQKRKIIWLLAALLFVQLQVTACEKKAEESTEDLRESSSVPTAESSSPSYAFEAVKVTMVQESSIEENTSQYDLSPQKETAANYDPRDIEAINAMIASNGLSVAKDDPEGWGFATWDSNRTMKRILELRLSHKGLTGDLDVSGLSDLQRLECTENQLKTLDVTGTALTFLNCSVNPLTEITGLSGLSGLQRLYCYYNQLRTLDVSALTNLTMLHCSKNQLQTLDLSALSALTELTCSDNQLEALNVSGLTNLTSLECMMNQLTEITGISSLSSLQTLRCFMNQLKALDVTGLTKLTGLLCYKNQLTELTGLSGLSSLNVLYCYENQLKTLDVSGLTALTELDCSNNRLETMDVSGMTEQTKLILSNNPYRLFQTSGGELTVNSGEGGAVAMTTFFQESNVVELTAIPDANCFFQSWMGLPVGVSNTTSIRFPLTGNISVSAAFDVPDHIEGNHNLVGEFIDENGDVNLIIKLEDGQYHVEISIFRLTNIDDGIGKSDGDKIIFTATDAGGSPISGEIIETAAGADVIFTNSTWGYISNGDKFSYYR